MSVELKEAMYATGMVVSVVLIPFVIIFMA